MKKWRPILGFSIFLIGCCSVLSIQENAFWRDSKYASGSLARVTLALERSWYDIKSQLKPYERAEGVMVATVDDASLKRFGRWPWSRAVYAEILERLYAAGASVVAFDAVFSEPELNQEIIKKSFLEPLTNLEKKSLAQNLKLSEAQLETISKNLPEVGDRIFARAVGNFPNTVLGYIWLFDKSRECAIYNKDNIADQKRYGDLENSAARSKGLLPIQDHEDALGSLYSQSFSQKGEAPFSEENRGNVFTGYCVAGNRSSIAAQAKHSGAFNTIHDDDGIVRRSQLLFAFDSTSLAELSDERKLFFPSEWFSDATFFPSLGLSALMSHWGIQKISVNMDSSPGIRNIREIILESPQRPRALRIPTLPDGSMMIRFYGRQDVKEAPIKSFSLADLEFLSDDAFQRKLFSQSLGSQPLAGQIVLIGPTALGVYDIRPTAIQQNSPGVFVHATAIARLLDFAKNHIPPGMNRVPMSFVWGAFILLSCVIMAFSLFSHFWASLGISLLLLALLPLADLFLFNHWSLVFPFATFTLLLFLVIFLLSLYRYFTEEKQKAFVRSAFQKYVSPEIVKSIIANPETLNLGGKKQKLTILFSDIRGFTSLAEKMEAATLSQFLNEYLSEMTDIILRNGGTIDKYIGDAIMAIFGAPVTLVDHDQRAVRTALEMIRKLEELNLKWESQGRPRIEIGIGLNSGEASVGNMGSKQIFSYTAVGDTVNLASRIESLTKQYAVSLLVSEECLKAWKGKEAFLLLDRVRVAGKNNAVNLFTLRTPSQEEFFLNYQVAYALYSRRDFSGCINKLAPWQHFKAAFNLSRRCGLFIEHPPAADWDASWTIQEK